MFNRITIIAQTPSIRHDHNDDNAMNNSIPMPMPLRERGSTSQADLKHACLCLNIGRATKEEHTAQNTGTDTE